MESSYEVIIQYVIRIMKGWDFLVLKSHPQTSQIVTFDSRAVLFRHRQAQKCLQINYKPLH